MCLPNKTMMTTTMTTTMMMKDPGRHQQPILPPLRYLNCRDYYAFKGSDRRRICAMMIGTDNTVLNMEFDFQWCLDQEPLCSFARELRPTNLCLQEELLRRAILSKTRVLPRPSQWEKDKILSALQNTYPPHFTPEDIQFLTKHISAMIDYYRKKKASQIMVDHNVRTIGWSSIQSYMRFYHILVDKCKEWDHIDTDAFWQDVTDRMNNVEWIPSSHICPTRKDFADCQALPMLFPEPVTVEVLRSKFRELCATLTSIRNDNHIGDDDHGNHDNGTVVVVPPPAPPPPLHVIYFIELLKQHELEIADILGHGNKDNRKNKKNESNENNETVVDPMDEGAPRQKPMDQESPRQTTNPDDIMMTSIEHHDDDDNVDASVPSLDPTVVSKIPCPVSTPRVPTCDDDSSPIVTSRTTRTRTTTTATANPSTHSLSRPGKEQSACAFASASFSSSLATSSIADYTYLESSRLYLNQLEFYNSLENEWLALEEKRLMVLQGDDAHSNNDTDKDNDNKETDKLRNNAAATIARQQQQQQKQQLYDTFCHRKQDSLHALTKRLQETAEYTERCAKRLCIERR